MLEVGKRIMVFDDDDEIGATGPTNPLQEDEEGKDEEAESLEENWMFVKNFLDNIRGRGNDNLSERSSKVIETMRKEMKNFVLTEQVTKTEDNLQDWRTTGAVPKSNYRKTMYQHKIEGTNSERSSNSSLISKKKKKKKEERRMKLERASTCESESSSPSATPKKKLRKRIVRDNRKSSSSDASPSHGSIGKLLRHLDFRPVPQLDSFNENSGQTLFQYLEKFEYYCCQNYKGKKYLWINELERHLTGGVLEALKSLHQFDDDYSEVKEKLLSWYRDESEIRKTRARKKFESARPKPKESLYIFGNRLETLYKIAHPRNNHNSSSTLIQQFKTAVCKKMRDVISSQILNYKLKGKKLHWREVQQCARLFDLERSMERSDERSSEDEKPKDIVINLSQKSGHHDQYPQPERRDNFDQGNHNGRTSVPYQPMVFQNSSRYPFPRQYRAPMRTQNLCSPNHAFQGNRSNVHNYQPRFMSNYRQPFNNAQASQNFASRFRFQNPPPTKNAQTCYFCGCFGHLKANCRMRLHSCFGCGEQGHFLRECSVNRGHKFPENSVRQNNVRSQSISPTRNPRFGQRRFQSAVASRPVVDEAVGMSNDKPLVLTREY